MSELECHCHFFPSVFDFILALLRLLSVNEPVVLVVGTASIMNTFFCIEKKKEKKISSTRYFKMASRDNLHLSTPVRISTMDSTDTGVRVELGGTMSSQGGGSSVPPSASGLGGTLGGTLPIPPGPPGYDPLHPTQRIADNVIFKEDFDYEGRTRIEKTKDKLLLEYDAYLEAHPEITPMLHDIVENLLIHKPERPLKDIRSYVRSRMGFTTALVYVHNNPLEARTLFGFALHVQMSDLGARIVLFPHVVVYFIILSFFMSWFIFLLLLIVKKKKSSHLSCFGWTFARQFFFFTRPDCSPVAFFFVVKNLFGLLPSKLHTHTIYNEVVDTRLRKAEPNHHTSSSSSSNLKAGFRTPAPAGPGGFGAPAAGPGGFGAPGKTNSSGFGAPAAAGGGFGAPAAGGTGGFGAPAGGTGGFGAPGKTNASGFGAPAAGGTGGFGAPAGGTGGFGAPGKTNASGFGAPAAAGGGFGAPAGGAGGFGAPAGGTGGFGAPASGAVGFGAGALATSQQQNQFPMTGMGGPYTVAPTPDVVQAEQLAKQSPMASYLIELDHAYDALHPQCRFRTFMYNICGPGLRDAAVHRERYVACMNGGGCSDEQWMRALQQNPDPIHRYPTPIHFAQEIQKRVEKQKEAIDIMIQRVQDLLQDIEAVAILDAANQATCKEIRQSEIMLQRRWYALLAKTETMGHQGSKGADGLLAHRAGMLRQQLDAPGGFQTTLDELQPYLEGQTARCALATRGTGVQPVPLLRSDVDPLQVRHWIQFMAQMQEGIEYLAVFLDESMNNISAVRDRVSSILRYCGCHEYPGGIFAVRGIVCVQKMSLRGSRGSAYLQTFVSKGIPFNKRAKRRSILTAYLHSSHNNCLPVFMMWKRNKISNLPANLPADGKRNHHFPRSLIRRVVLSNPGSRGEMQLCSVGTPHNFLFFGVRKLKYSSADDAAAEPAENVERLRQLNAKKLRGSVSPMGVRTDASRRRLRVPTANFHALPPHSPFPGLPSISGLGLRRLPTFIKRATYRRPIRPPPLAPMDEAAQHAIRCPATRPPPGVPPPPPNQTPTRSIEDANSRNATPATAGKPRTICPQIKMRPPKFLCAGRKGPPEKYPGGGGDAPRPHSSHHAGREINPDRGKSGERTAAPTHETTMDRKAKGENKARIYKYTRNGGKRS
eukprot:gene7491-5278_t